MPTPQRPSQPTPSMSNASRLAGGGTGGSSGGGRRLPPQLWTTKSMILLSTCVASSAYLFGLFQGFEKGKAVAVRDMAAASAGPAAGGEGAQQQQQEMDKMRNDPSAGIYAGR